MCMFPRPTRTLPSTPPLLLIDLACMHPPPSHLARGNAADASPRAKPSRHARSKSFLCPTGFLPGGGGPSTLPCLPPPPGGTPMIYMCYTFMIMQPALSCPEQNLRRSIERGHLYYVHVCVSECMYYPGAGPRWLTGWLATLADGRTCGCATPQGGGRPSGLRRRRGPWREWWMGGEGTTAQGQQGSLPAIQQ